MRITDLLNEYEHYPVTGTTGTYQLGDELHSYILFVTYSQSPLDLVELEELFVKQLKAYLDDKREGFIYWRRYPTWSHHEGKWNITCRLFRLRKKQ